MADQLETLEDDRIDQVRTILVEACARRGLTKVVWPSREALALTFRHYPEVDHLAVARDLAFWITAGDGRRRQVKNVAQRYRNFVRVQCDRSGREGSNGAGREELSRRRREAAARLGIDL